MSDIRVAVTQAKNSWVTYQKLLFADEAKYCMEAPNLACVRAELRVKTRKILGTNRAVERLTSGRPFIDSMFSLSFSHKESWCAIAIGSAAHQVGVDVEALFEQIDFATFHGRFFNSIDYASSLRLQHEMHLHEKESNLVLFSVKEAALKTLDLQFPAVDLRVNCEFTRLDEAVFLVSSPLGASVHAKARVDRTNKIVVSHSYLPKSDKFDVVYHS